MFCCSIEQKEKIKCHNNSKLVYQGYPAIERSVNTEFNEKQPVVLWTPRWSDNKKYGGTNFFEFYKKIPTLISDFPEIKLLLRPHPLTFENAVREGRMTEDEVNCYFKDMDVLGIAFDHNTFIEDTFEKTDIMVTDETSAMIHFFVTGKPIIYCARTDLDFSNVFQEIIDCSYKAADWNDVHKFISDILSGNDPLKEKREKTAERYRNAEKNASASILNYLYNDCKNR